MAFESLASRSSLPKPGCSQRRIFHRLPDGPIAKLMVAFCQCRWPSDVAVSLALSSADLDPGNATPDRPLGQRHW